MVEGGFRTILCDAVTMYEDVWEKVAGLKKVA
eukprot:CAMPEP_0168314146 /NCGR_PEP_ID=MMETSP0210-20121227/6585_1 /TAXON_ID=40633 /ORGANISM="Condylostoma magnum, Strain COL2" /LENGTH=31 /DNA_ID= /DNA_START= /DNA_END= /DNA_ORIENTATION=